MRNFKCHEYSYITCGVWSKFFGNIYSQLKTVEINYTDTPTLLFLQDNFS